MSNSTNQVKHDADYDAIKKKVVLSLPKTGRCASTRRRRYACQSSSRTCSRGDRSGPRRRGAWRGPEEGKRVFFSPSTSSTMSKLSFFSLSCSAHKNAHSRQPSVRDAHLDAHGGQRGGGGVGKGGKGKIRGRGRNRKRRVFCCCRLSRSLLSRANLWLPSSVVCLSLPFHFFSSLHRSLSLVPENEFGVMPLVGNPTPHFRSLRSRDPVRLRRLSMANEKPERPRPTRQSTLVDTQPKKRSMPALASATSASATLLLDLPSSPCYYPEEALLAEDESTTASDLRLARGFERASTVIARARVAGSALRCAKRRRNIAASFTHLSIQSAQAQLLFRSLEPL